MNKGDVPLFILSLMHQLIREGITSKRCRYVLYFSRTTLSYVPLHWYNEANKTTTILSVFGNTAMILCMSSECTLQL